MKLNKRGWIAVGLLTISLFLCFGANAQLRQEGKNIAARFSSFAAPKTTTTAVTASRAAATLMVMNLADNGPGSLRQVVGAAASGDTITFDPNIHGSLLQLTSGAINVDKSLTIIGPGANSLSLSGNNASRVFNIYTPFGETPIRNVTISGLTLKDGFNLASINNQAGGGGIRSHEVNLTLNDCVITTNTSSSGGGIEQKSGSLTMNRCTVSGNHSNASGGGIETAYCVLTLNECSITGNTAGAGGGGIRIGQMDQSYPATLNHCTISGNTAPRGGGIDQFGGTLNATNCTISGNTATGTSGGGVFVSVQNTQPLISDLFTHCTMTGNHAAYYGGGMYVDGLSDALGQVRLLNTIVAGNTASQGSPETFGRVTSLGHNLFGNASVVVGGGGTDLFNTNPQLRPLAYNGGPTLTQALPPTSPAVNAGDNSTLSQPYSVGRDQRGAGRVHGAVDIGAYEYRAQYVNNLNDSGAGSLRQAITDAFYEEPITFALGLTGTITLTSGPLLITTPLTLTGPGANVLTVSGNNISRVLQNGNANNAPTVTLSHLTLANGKADDEAGGGLANYGTLTMTGVTIRDGQRGGGFYNHGTASLSDCTIADNVGSGIIHPGNTLTIRNSTISGNNSGLIGNGGGLRLDGGTVELKNVTVSGNRANQGGGLWVAKGSITLFNCTVVENQAIIPAGSGIYSALPNSIFPFVGQVTLVNNIVARNVPFPGPDGDVAGFLISWLGGNLLGNNANNYPFYLGDLSNLDPKLSALGFYGGSTKTHLPWHDSPAINAGKNYVTGAPYSLTTDQRGAARNANGAVDSGATEAVIRFWPTIIPSGKIGVAYDKSISATFNAPSGTVTLPTVVSGDSLPAGLSLSAGRISGTPTEAKTSHLTFRATTANGIVGLAKYPLTIVSSPPVMYGVAGRELERGVVTPNVQLAIVSDGETAAGALEITVTNVPTGMYISHIANNNGTITATITLDCPAQLGPNHVTLRVRDGGGETTTNSSTFLVVNTAALGNYANATVYVGASLTHQADAWPLNMTNLSASAPGFTGTFNVDSYGTVQVSNAGPVGTHTVTVRGIAYCDLINKTFSLRVSNNQSPAVTPAPALTRVQNAAGSISTLATISDLESPAANLAVTATTIPAGLSVTNLTNSNGTVTANVAAACDAAVGANTLVLSVSDGEATTTANVTINATPASTGMLGNYANAYVPIGGSSIITPDATPSGGITPVTISAPTFTGNLSIDPTTGVISVSNAGAAGTHAITVQLANACVMTRQTFTLTVTGSPCNALDFVAASGAPYAAGTQPYDATAGDFNGDGKADLVVVNFGSDSVSILLNNGTGGFGAKTDYAVGDQPTMAAVGDFNRDNKNDLVVANGNAQSISVFLGRGDGTFNAKTDYSTGTSSPFSLGLADFNNDGRIDIAVTNFVLNAVSVFLGNGNGTFAAKLDAPTLNGPYSLAAGDLNGDGKMDLVVSYLSTPNISLLFGQGDGRFATPVSYPSTGGVNKCGVDDFNGDGQADVFLTNNTYHSVTTYLNNGNGTLAAKPDYVIGAGTNPRSVVAGDFNGDGKRDFATGNRSTNNVSVVLGNGDGTFGAKTDFAVGTQPYDVTAADFNGDGKTDLATSNFGSNNASVFLNTCVTPPTITAGAALTRWQGAAASIATLANITGNAPLTVTATTIPTGISVTNLVSTNGTVTANVAANCSAAPGSNTIILTVTDASAATATANVTVNVTATSATLGNYFSATTAVQSSITITPDAAPTGNAPVFSASAPGFTGNVSVNASTGVISITNAKPVGTYPFTVRDVCGTATKTFTLSVTGEVCATTSLVTAGGSPIAVGGPINSIQAADFNGDNKMDLVFADYWNKFHLMLGDGAGGFGPRTEYFVGLSSNTVAVDDLNGDGKADVAVTNNGSHTVRIALGNGAGSLGAGVEYAVGNVPIGIATGDFNGDGKRDLVTANYHGNSVSILLGNGTGGFGSKSDFAASTSPYSVVVSDFNADGKDDVAVSNSSAHTVSVLLGTGTGGLLTKTDFSVGNTPYTIAIGDFNNDRIPDLVTSNVGNNTITYLLGNGTGGFGSATSIAVGNYPHGVTVGDLNGDGKDDILTANSSSNTVSLLLGDGAGSFGAKTDFPASTAPRTLVAGNFNGDGKLDVAVGNFDGFAVTALLNSCSLPPQPPAIMPAATLTRTQNVTATNATIATVSDKETAAGALVVTAPPVPTGLTISNIVNSNGTITADIAASCAASLGSNQIVLAVTDASGLTATANLIVNVTNPLSVTTAPTAQTVTAEQMVTFTAAASNNQATVQWQVSVNGGQFWTKVQGATSTTLSFRASTAQGGNRYRAVFSNCGVNVNSSEAVLTVNASVNANTLGLVISEFRLRGNSTQPELDEYIELYNNTNNDITVNTTDGSEGWALAALNADGNTSTVLMSIPNGIVIPAKAHLLLVNDQTNGYSLSAVAPGDFVFINDIADDTGVAIFNTANPANFVTNTVIDAIGFQLAGTAAALFREGTGLASLGNNNGEYAWVRKMQNGLANDTNDNAADFVLVHPNRSTINGVTSQLGAPGPENSASTLEVNRLLFGTLFDLTVAITAAPNQARDQTPVTNGDFGTLSLRRSFTNNTSAPLTKLRFRVIDITNSASGAEADLRLLSSTTATINGQVVQGVTLEEPPTQSSGGGVNATVLVGTITTSQPLAIGATVNVEFKLGVMRKGAYRFYLNIEALQ